MGRGVNKVIIVGNLGQDPDIRFFPSGGSVCNVTVATSETWKDKQTGEQKEHTEWHRLAFKDRLAEIAAEHLKKGSKVYIEGKLITRKWQNQQGQEQYTTEIRVKEMQMLDSKPSDAKPQQASQGYQQNPKPQQMVNQNYASGVNAQQPNPKHQGANVDFDDDDIPF